MARKNEKLIAALEEVAELKFKLVAAQAEIKGARKDERIRIAALILKADGE